MEALILHDLTSEKIKLHEELLRLYETFGVTEEEEKLALSEKRENIPEALELGLQRSFQNTRDSLRGYFEWRVGKGTPVEEIFSELNDKVEKIKGTLVMSYYEDLPDAGNIIEYGGLKNLFEFAEVEQDTRKKAAEFSLEAAIIKRKNIDKALGWAEPEKVYHLAVEQREEGHEMDGPSSNYGSVRLVFDYEVLSENSTFSEGDSLNPAQLPQALFKKRDLGSSSRAVERRQISKEHVLIAKAILSLATELGDDRDMKRPIFLRYVEAQVGGISGSDIFKTLKAIEVDLKSAFEEARSSRLLFDLEKMDEIYQKYFKTKSNSSSSLDLFREDAPVVDIEGYHREITDLIMENYNNLLNKQKSYCGSLGIEYVERGNIEEIKNLCARLIKNSAF